MKAKRLGMPCLRCKTKTNMKMIRVRSEGNVWKCSECGNEKRVFTCKGCTCQYNPGIDSPAYCYLFENTGDKNEQACIHYVPGAADSVEEAKENADRVRKDYYNGIKIVIAATIVGLISLGLILRGLMI